LIESPAIAVGGGFACEWGLCYLGENFNRFDRSNSSAISSGSSGIKRQTSQMFSERDGLFDLGLFRQPNHIDSPVKGMVIRCRLMRDLFMSEIMEMNFLLADRPKNGGDFY
jgi:hypothetical protein